MDLKAVREISGFEGRLTKFAIDYDGVPTLVQRREGLVSYFVDENGVMLMFNSFDELVQIALVRLF